MRSIDQSLAGSGRDISAAGDLGATLTETAYYPEGRFGQGAWTEARTPFAGQDLTLPSETTSWDQFNRPTYQPPDVFFVQGTSSPSVVPYNPAWTP